MLNNYLDNIASELIIKGKEDDAIRNSIDAFGRNMTAYFKNYESVNLEDIKVFGSYDRDTDLPQSIDTNTDVDIMLVMEDDQCTPQTYLDRVRRAVKKYYTSSEIKQSSPTIVLQMNHIKFEITPAIKDAGVYRIKNDDNYWIMTSCVTDFNNLTTANKSNYYMIKPTIRLIKYWNVSKNYKAISSYELEKTIVNHYYNCQYQGYDTKSYLLTGLESLRIISMSRIVRERLEKAISNVKSAIDFESVNEILSCNYMEKVIDEL